LGSFSSLSRTRLCGAKDSTSFHIASNFSPLFAVLEYLARADGFVYPRNQWLPWFARRFFGWIQLTRGNSVRGGKAWGDWPGLKNDLSYEGRDLALS